MTETPFNPEELYPQWNQALMDIHDFLAEIDKAEKAGLDVRKQRAEMLKHKENFERLKAVYFPDRP